MSTNAIIKLEGFKAAQLYKHWDGYPSATLLWLQKFNKEFTEKRGDDSSYKFAQLIRSSVSMGTEFELDDSKETGWGVLSASEKVGAHFEYRLLKDGTVTVKEI